MEEKNNNIKLYLIMFSLLLVCLLIFNYFIKSAQSKKDIWKYSEITSASDVLNRGTKTSARDVYYTLDKIVVKYVESYLVEDEESNWTKYYEVLSKDYSKFLNKKEYSAVAESFLKKFYVYSEDIEIDASEYMDVQDIIVQVYSYEDNRYLCYLESSITGNTGYIGIELNTKNNTYSIFYIE